MLRAQTAACAGPGQGLKTKGPGPSSDWLMTQQTQVGGCSAPVAVAPSAQCSLLGSLREPTSARGTETHRQAVSTLLRGMPSGAVPPSGGTQL